MTAVLASEQPARSWWDRRVSTDEHTPTRDRDAHGAETAPVADLQRAWPVRTGIVIAMAAGGAGLAVGSLTGAHAVFHDVDAGSPSTALAASALVSGSVSRAVAFRVRRYAPGMATADVSAA
jgi:hypothetical protein